jgi:hypothetical protein
VSTAGGTRPNWSHNGQEIFFAHGNEDLGSVAVRPGKSFTTGEQRVLLSLRGVTDWDVAPDDRRFIIIRDRQGQQRRKLVVVENVFEELKAKAPR